MHTIIYAVVVIFCFQIFTCLGDQKQDNSRLNFFDTDLLRYTAESQNGNVLLSPASIKSTLAMLLEGAEGDTAAEIISTLRLNPNKNDYREQLNSFLEVLKAHSNGTFLQNTNAVFATKELKMKKEYETMLKNVYMAEVRKVNFKNPAPTVDEINTWVNNATKGLIPSIISTANVNPAMNMLVTNALYFKSTWKHAFDPRKTHGGCFHRHGSGCYKVDMMELQADLEYAFIPNLRAHALELPYENGRYSMIILVPQDKNGCSALIRDLPYMSVSQISSKLESNDVTLIMPKFTIDYREDMVKPLRDMRITKLFSVEASLPGMFEGASSHVDNLFHKVHVAVDEGGTVAAAATAAMVVPLIQRGVTLRVDRPFVFFIRDNSLGMVLFEGRVEKPNEHVEGKGQPTMKIGAATKNKSG